MLSPSDFNNAVPQFTNGNYASNPINPEYIAEPDAESYNRGTEPLQTLPAQWWNWFVNKFTARFNKVNIYVKNIFNELAQVLSIFNITPDGTEQTPTTSQLKTVFETCYPQYVKTAANLVGTDTTVNGHPLSSNVTVTRSDLGLGTSATVNTGTAVGCIPTVGTALGTTNNNILVTDSTGKLKPSGITVGTAAGCDATLFARKTEVDALYGNVVGTPLGTASVGTCTTFARSDHVHPSHVYTTVTIDAPGTGSWDEGLRINRAPSGWALLNIGGLANSINGCNGAFTISCYEPEGTKLFVAWQGSCASSYFEPEGNAGAVKWHGNVCGVASCAGHAEYATSAGTASCLNGFENNNDVPKDANYVTYNAITYYAANGPTIAQGASVNDGALYSQAWSDVWVGQIAQDYRNGRLFVRGRNNGTWMPWLNIIDSGNIGSQSVACAGSATSASNLVASGGTDKEYFTSLSFSNVAVRQCSSSFTIVQRDSNVVALQCDLWKAFTRVASTGSDMSGPRPISTFGQIRFGTCYATNSYENVQCIYPSGGSWIIKTDVNLYTISQNNTGGFAAINIEGRIAETFPWRP